MSLLRFKSVRQSRDRALNSRGIRILDENDQSIADHDIGGLYLNAVSAREVESCEEVETLTAGVLVDIETEVISLKKVHGHDPVLALDASTWLRAVTVSVNVPSFITTPYLGRVTVRILPSRDIDIEELQDNTFINCNILI